MTLVSLHQKIRKDRNTNLTGETFAEFFYGGGHFLLADALIFLSFCGGLEPLPGQTAAQTVHEHVAQGLHVVPATLLCGQETHAHTQVL